MQSVQIPSKSEYYDTLPYDSFSFPHSHPARLAAVASLFGLTPPQNKKFRVLELGAASGGNLIPLAIFYPEVELVGVDYSVAQVDKGQKLIKALDLQNRVKLLCQSITELDTKLGTFDYIICHGVYSWVPVEVQDAIITSIKKHLKPNGIAYVSYNVYPGWKRLEILRDMMLYHTRLMSEQQPQNRLAQGRAIVDFIRNLSHEHSGIRQMIDAPWEEFKKQSDSYLGHELLEPVNQPCYFLDFAEKLAAHNLTYLADAEPSISFIQGLPQQKITDLIQASQNNQVMLEQYMDFLYFRQFRKSLIIHEKAAASIQRKIPIEVFDIFDYSVDFCIEEQTQNDSPSVIASTTAHAGNTSINPNSEANTLKQHEHRFIFSHNRVVSVFNKTDYALFKGISELSPKIFNKKQLLDVINKKQSDPQLKQHLSKMLNRLSLTGYADIWHQLPSVTPTFELEEKPYMPELMRRFYKETGHLSNYRHSTISLNIVQQQLIDILDGEHDRKQMHAHLRKSLAEGFINLRDNNNQPLAEDQIDNALSAHLEQALNLLRLNALLYKKQS